MYEICKVRDLPLLSYPECMRIALEEGPICLRMLSPLAEQVLHLVPLLIFIIIF